jgi:hypothetical protein
MVQLYPDHDPLDLPKLTLGGFIETKLTPLMKLVLQTYDNSNVEEEIRNNKDDVYEFATITGADTEYCALSVACYFLGIKTSLNSIKILLDKGADPSKWDNWSCKGSYLHYLLRSESKDKHKAIKLLLEKGAKIKYVQKYLAEYYDEELLYLI